VTHDADNSIASLRYVNSFCSIQIFLQFVDCRNELLKANRSAYNSYVAGQRVIEKGLRRGYNVNIRGRGVASKHVQGPMCGSEVPWFAFTLLVND
jgi:hypothetical protein